MLLFLLLQLYDCTMPTNVKSKSQVIKQKTESVQDKKQDEQGKKPAVAPPQARLGVDKDPNVDPSTSGPNHHYTPSKWDPALGAMSEDIIQSYIEKNGFMESHSPPAVSYKGAFGDLSLITWNTYQKAVSLEGISDMFVGIEAMLDHAHPTILAIQGVRSELLDKMAVFGGSSHYKVTNTEQFDIDTYKGAKMYFPIVYDSEVLTFEKGGFLRAGGKIYASHAEFSDKRHGNNKFTVVNIDNSFTTPSVVDNNMGALLSDVIDTKEIKDNPVIIMGGIGIETDFIKKLYALQYKNTIKEDKNNEGTRLTTMHGSNGMDDGVQRDFIIIRDSKKVLGIAYSRILKEGFTLGQHYPVHAIISYMPPTAAKPAK